VNRKQQSYSPAQKIYKKSTEKKAKDESELLNLKKAMF